MPVFLANSTPTRGLDYRFRDLPSLDVSEKVGRSESQYQYGYAMALDWLPHLGAQPLTWLLDSLQGAGYSRDESLIAGGIARLLVLQHENGTWTDPHTPVETTVTALRLFRDYDVESR